MSRKEVSGSKRVNAEYSGYTNPGSLLRQSKPERHITSSPMIPSHPNRQQVHSPGFDIKHKIIALILLPTICAAVAFTARPVANRVNLRRDWGFCLSCSVLKSTTDDLINSTDGHNTSTKSYFSSEFSIVQAKQALLEQIQAGVDGASPALEPYLDALQSFYKDTKMDARYMETYNGDWRNLNTPAFVGRLGFDANGLPLYTISSLTFGLIPAAKMVVCAVEKMVQRVYFVAAGGSNTAMPEYTPEGLHDTVKDNPSGLRTNTIDTFFKIPDSTVGGILRMEGYTIPSKDVENKHDAWFVGGRCFAKEGVDNGEWERIFGTKESVTEEGALLEYSLPKPIPAFQTVIYLDDDLRISIGNRGSLLIVGRDEVYSHW
jgi:hypothetical protein